MEFINKVFHDYCPLTSQISGFGRFLTGIIDIVVNLAKVVFQDDESHGENIKNLKDSGIKVGKALLACIPIVGNIALIIIDLVQVKKDMEGFTAFT